MSVWRPADKRELLDKVLHLLLVPGCFVRAALARKYHDLYSAIRTFHVRSTKSPTDSEFHVLSIAAIQHVRPHPHTSNEYTKETLFVSNPLSTRKQSP